MFAKLESLERKYLELEESLADPEVFNNQERYRKLAKSHADLEPIVTLFRKHKDLANEIDENKLLLHDEDNEDEEHDRCRDQGGQDVGNDRERLYAHVP